MHEANAKNGSEPLNAGQNINHDGDDVSEFPGAGLEPFHCFKSLDNLLVDAVDQIYGSIDKEKTGNVAGIATGFRDIDSITSLHPGDLIIIAGRPSTGKSALSENIAENVSLNGQHSVAVFSMEQNASQVTMRMIGSVGRLDTHNELSGQISEECWPRLSHALGRLNQASVFIDDSPRLTVTEVCARARCLAEQCGKDKPLGLIVIDCLQLITGADGDADREALIAHIVRSLKSLAKELQAAVIATSQLDRALERRNDKRPVMSDLPGAGAIEEVADVILFIYRDEIYNLYSEDKGTAEIIIEKQRNGPTGVVRLAYLGEYTKFETLTGSVDYPTTWRKGDL